MQLNSLVFLFGFFPVFLVFWFLIPWRWRNIYLVFVSLVFYFWVEGRYFWVFLGALLVNYLWGLWLERVSQKKSARWVIVGGLVLNVLFLCGFKYGVEPGLMPAGISFFTFLYISYLIDVYRRQAPVLRNPLNFGFYIAFFPKLLTGPITRYQDFYSQIQPKKTDLDTISLGIHRLIIGLGKKVLLADTLAKTANAVFAIPVSELSWDLAWMGLVSYALQIYYDFSGYSDMAIGLAFICGVRLPENFNYPYMARSIKDFWKRWHMSLSQWLQTYLFLPVAYKISRWIPQDRLWGIKAENWSYFAGAFITMLVCGMWHGAHWTFVIWGLYYGILLILEHAGWEKKLKKKPVVLRIALTQGLVLLGWILFRSVSLGYAWGFFKALWGLGSGSYYYSVSQYLDAEWALVMAVGLLGCFPWAQRFYQQMAVWQRNWTGWKQCFLISIQENILLLWRVVVFFWSFLGIASQTYNPFIYFRF